MNKALPSFSAPLLSALHATSRSTVNKKSFVTPKYAIRPHIPLVTAIPSTMNMYATQSPISANVSDASNISPPQMLQMPLLAAPSVLPVMYGNLTTGYGPSRTQSTQMYNAVSDARYSPMNANPMIVNNISVGINADGTFNICITPTAMGTMYHKK